MSISKSLRILAHRFLIPIGIDTRKTREDRQTLERTIFPVLLRDASIQSILFVGCAWYTLHYPSLFAKKRFITLEIDPEECKYGAREHIVDSCSNMDQHFAPNSLDAIVFNGVFGHGLFDKTLINQTFQAMLTVLRPGGLLIFGWNDQPGKVPCSIQEISALSEFVPYVFPVLNTAIFESSGENRHRFHFYAKPVGPVSTTIP